MNTNTFRVSLLLIAASFGASGALASESLCADDLCANYEEASWGENGCDDGNPDYYGYRGYSVTYRDGSSDTGAYVYQYCWSYDDGESTGHGNALSVAVTRLDWEQFRMDGVVVYWESGEWNGSHWCQTMLIGHTPVGLHVFEPLGCPAGDAPPMILPALP